MESKAKERSVSKIIFLIVTAVGLLLNVTLWLKWYELKAHATSFYANRQIDWHHYRPSA